MADETDKLTTMASAIRESKTKTLTNDTNMLFDALVTTQTNATLHENIFKQVFLPYFNGEIQLTEDTPIFSKWVEYSGSPYASVDIIDNEGNTLYTVPPIMLRSDLDKSNLDILNLANVPNEYELRSNRFKAEGDGFLTVICSNIADNFESENKDGVNATWDKIIGDKINETAVDGTPIEDDISDDDLEY